ncbi:geranylgeranyl transferase type-2 subunit alpha [Colletotrichum karsti]|uniref:Geranylgeranyl transferase type-2 subunit alpha n=1 Tax=Colletotrichum karsti TaxID=1095194 RepID=A0A9P6I8V4_9PEZI|nr:geranylgeranyl transferase type-2 subunit alpha [Colletotrichum karsti]KAF9878493.1 geranylgeranyl transferase type-2 subunit alpha [Colletotrichum karsti]
MSSFNSRPELPPVSSTPGRLSGHFHLSASLVHGVARTARKPRTEAQLQADLAKIATLRSLEDSLLRASPDLSDPETFSLTTKLLRLNPEHYTAWNVRRRCLTCGSLSRPSPGPSPSAQPASSSAACTQSPSSADSLPSSSTTTQPDPASRTTPESGKSGTTVDDGKDVTSEAKNAPSTEVVIETLKNELMFTIPLLLEFPKSYWIWKYRSWLLQQGIDLLPKAMARRIWEEELGLISKMLTKDRRNFHAWGYRREVVTTLESKVLDGKSMVESEFEYTTKMINVDLSNFSAWHNRTNLIPRLLDERKADDAARQKFLDDELNLVREALNVGPEDQSLWYYHQFLVLNLTESENGPKIAPNLSQKERAEYVKREIDDIKELAEDYDDVVGIYKALLDYTRALPQIEERSLTDDETADLKAWMAKVRQLDPMRSGRWSDLERECGLV